VVVDGVDGEMLLCATVVQVIRQRGHGFAADIWSFGCTVLEMATGKPPWSQCSTQVQAIFKIASSSELPHIPEWLSPEGTEFVLLCLQRDAAQRPTAEALLRHPFVAGVELTSGERLMDLLSFPCASPPPAPLRAQRTRMSLHRAARGKG
jgi:serine/threonine protein kinase